MNTTTLIERRSFMTFIFVGVLTFLLYLAVYSVVWQWENRNYMLAITVANIISLLFHFILTRQFSFRQKGARNLKHHSVKYGVIIVGNYLSTLILFHLLVIVLQVNHYLALILISGFNAMINYFLYRFWVFK